MYSTRYMASIQGKSSSSPELYELLPLRTFLEALAMVGGLDWYTRRDRIGVMREVDGRRVIHYLDPRSTEIFNDEFFVLQQNDIIFTEERPYKFFNANLNTVLGFISSITGLVTSAVAMFSLYKMFDNWSW